MALPLLDRVYCISRLMLFSKAVLKMCYLIVQRFFDGRVHGCLSAVGDWALSPWTVNTIRCPWTKKPI